MLALLQSLGRDKALWVGHDWGSPVAWSLASHRPERCLGIANLCIPYLAEGFAPQTLIPLVDRTSTWKSNFPLVNGTTNSFTRRISTGLAPVSRPTPQPLFEPYFVGAIQQTQASPTKLRLLGTPGISLGVLAAHQISRWILYF
jgi:pimeloyl-ACP methyl ester carboxylesterase